MDVPSSLSSTRPSLSDQSLSPMVTGRFMTASTQSSVPAGLNETEPRNWLKRATLEGGSSSSAAARAGAKSAASDATASKLKKVTRLAFFMSLSPETPRSPIAPNPQTNWRNPPAKIAPRSQRALGTPTAHAESATPAKHVTPLHAKSCCSFCAAKHAPSIPRLGRRQCHKWTRTVNFSHAFRSGIRCPGNRSAKKEPFEDCSKGSEKSLSRSLAMRVTAARRPPAAAVTAAWR